MRIARIVVICTAILVSLMPALALPAVSGFTINKGQWNADIVAVGAAPGQRIIVKSDALFLDYYKIENGRIKGTTLKIDFKDAARLTNILSNTPEYKVNYFIGNDKSKWQTDIPCYKEITLKDIYRGTDLRLYKTEEGFRYDFVLSPNADPERIAMHFSGCNAMQIADNNLVVKTNFGELQHKYLKAYQYADKSGYNEVSCEYSLANDNTVNFKLGYYDRTKALTIDPLLYSSFLGGIHADEAMDMEIDRNGNFYITGSTLSADFPVTGGSYDASYNSNMDMFITKFDPNGNNIIYSTFIGGILDDIPSAIAVDGSGNVYFTGKSLSSDFPMVMPYQPSLKGSWDAIAGKLNMNGNVLVYSTFIGSTGDDQGLDIAVSASGLAHICGKTESQNFPVTNGVFDNSYNGYGDGFALALSANGASLMFSTFLGGANLDWATSIAVDKNNYIYVAGVTTSSNFMTAAGSFDMGYNGLEDVFLMKFNAAANMIDYSTYIGGGQNEEPTALIVDDAGIAYLCGWTKSGNFPVRGAALDSSINGLNTTDMFVTKVSPDGSSLLYSSYLGGRYDDKPLDMRIDAAGNMYLCGVTNSDDFPVTPASFSESLNGGSDAFINVLNNAGSAITYSSYIGGTADEYASGIGVETGTNVMICGATESANFPVTASGYDNTYNGGRDAFYFKLADIYKPQAVVRWKDNLICSKDSFKVPIAVSSAFDAGNRFNIELSDQYRDFSNPYIIGTKLSANKDTIQIYIPDSIPAGLHYRMRVSANSPAMQGVDNGFDIAINPRPSALLKSGDTVSCHGAIAPYKASDLPAGVSYQWTITNGTVVSGQGEQDLQVMWGNDSTGSVKLIMTSAQGCKDSSLTNVRLTNVVAANLESGNLSSCLGAEELYKTPHNDSVTYTKWSVTKGGTIIGPDNLDSVLVKWTKTGQESVILERRVISQSCAATGNWFVNLSTAPNVTFDKVPDLCVSDSAVELKGATPPGGKFSGKGIINGTYFSPSIAGAGIHEIIYSYTNTYGCTGSFTQNVRVLPAPAKPVVTQEGDSLISTPAAFYQWYMDNQKINGASGRYLKPAYSGSYSVSVADSSLICWSEKSVPYSYVKGDADDPQSNAITVVPQPASQYLNIQFRGDFPGQINLVIYDILGRAVMAESHQGLSSSSLKLDISAINSGMYYLEIQSGGRSVFKRILIAKE